MAGARGPYDVVDVGNCAGGNVEEAILCDDRARQLEPSPDVLVANNVLPEFLRRAGEVSSSKLMVVLSKDIGRVFVLHFQSPPPFRDSLRSSPSHLLVNVDANAYVTGLENLQILGLVTAPEHQDGVVVLPKYAHHVPR